MEFSSLIVLDFSKEHGRRSNQVARSTAPFCCLFETQNGTFFFDSLWIGCRFRFVFVVLLLLLLICGEGISRDRRWQASPYWNATASRRPTSGISRRIRIRRRRPLRSIVGRQFFFQPFPPFFFFFSPRFLGDFFFISVLFAATDLFS